MSSSWRLIRVRVADQQSGDWSALFPENCLSAAGNLSKTECAVRLGLDRDVEDLIKCGNEFLFDLIQNVWCRFVGVEFIQPLKNDVAQQLMPDFRFSGACFEGSSHCWNSKAFPKRRKQSPLLIG